MKIRARILLLSWPLGVAAVVVLSLRIDRRTSVELQRIERQMPAAVSSPELQRLADALAGAMVRSDTVAVLRQVAAWRSGPHAALAMAVLDERGALLASTEPELRPASPRGALGTPRTWQRAIRSKDGGIAVAELQLIGHPLRAGAPPRAVGELVLLPADAAVDADQRAGAWLAALRQTLWRSALAVGLTAGVLALLLAAPLVRRIRRLSLAARAIGAGDLAVRVPVRGDDELDDLARSFNAMSGALQDARAQQQRMIADVAHELRTPLTNIIGLIEAMQDGLKPLDASSLASLRDEGALLERLVTDLQDLQLAESGHLALNITAVDGAALVRRVVAAMQPRGGGVTLGTHEPMDHGEVRADATRLEQVLRNLLQNAITATPDGGEVRASVSCTSNTVTVTVRDTGIGMSASELARIWDRFYRVDASRSRHAGGMGLGLTLVKELVEAMGGSVRAESTPGVGSAFSVSLPRAAD